MRKPDYPSDNHNQWSAVDCYFSNLFAPQDDIFINTLKNNKKNGLPEHDVSDTQGKLLSLYIKMIKAKRILEIGTLGGYSTIWMARSLPIDGKIITIEANEHHASVAKQNIEKTGLKDRVEIHIGAALNILPLLTGPFDLIFIDADKANNPLYLKWSLGLSRPGTVIIGDNVVRGGAVIEEKCADESVIGVRKFLQMMSEEPRLTCTAIQTVGEKGWDGFAIAVVE
ncbi:methyltransferase [Brenneria goodwinii]|uniref:Methyltransferase n=1 Tax=Brenneria goodwinii TaxID=1109412 RepID=A0AAE8JLH2_9GAMM|nr:O-methyltransferase [Brenneria goodwinii]ATA23120.1 methyltransferase [Brenneria goodwinii]RLM17835.1 methyltransferase [Brenneria goodwinii]